MPEVPNLDQIAILVVDDNPFMRRIIKTILNVLHCDRVFEAAVGARTRTSKVQTGERAAPKPRPDSCRRRSCKS